MPQNQYSATSVQRSLFNIGSILLVLAALLCILAAPSAFAQCSAEFAYCGDDNEGVDSGPGPSPSGVRDGDKSYGAHYTACSASGQMGGKCQECVYDYRKNTYVCAGVRHSSACECVESYKNYIIVGCGTYGSCEYYP